MGVPLVRPRGEKILKMKGKLEICGLHNNKIQTIQNKEGHTEEQNLPLPC